MTELIEIFIIEIVPLRYLAIALAIGLILWCIT